MEYWCNDDLDFRCVKCDLIQITDKLLNLNRYAVHLPVAANEKLSCSIRL